MIRNYFWENHENLERFDYPMVDDKKDEKQRDIHYDIKEKLPISVSVSRFALKNSSNCNLLVTEVRGRLLRCPKVGSRRAQTHHAVYSLAPLLPTK